MHFASAQATTTTTQATPNFLVPNGTIIVELILFIVVLGIVAKFILPPLMRAMNDREAKVRAALQASDEGHVEAAQLDEERQRVLEAARVEARARIEGAARESEEIVAEARQRGQAKHDRLIAAAEPGLDADRRQLREQVAAGLGDVIVQAAERIVGGAVAPTRHRELIDDAVARARAEDEVLR